MSSPLSLLIIQLRTAYPTVSLLSELAAIESNVFVVRALIQIGSLTLATGMAAAADIEAAEDRAKCRAIETLLPPAASAIPAAPVSAVASQFPEGGIAKPVASSPSQPAASSQSSLPALSPLPSLADSIPPQAEPRRNAPSLSAPQTATPPHSPSASTASPDALTDWDNPLRSSPSGSNLDFDFDLNTLLQDSAPDNSPATPPAAPEETEPPLPAADLFAAVNADPAAPIDPPVNLSDLNLKKLSLPQDNSSPPETLAGAEKPARRKSPVSSVSSVPSDVAPTAVVPTATPPLPESEFSSAAPAPPAEIDRSGEIARIGVEMKRLGWDTKKGRDHLQKTYGKRSRQELNDDELMDFLHYLETQPSSAQMPF